MQVDKAFPTDRFFNKFLCLVSPIVAVAHLSENAAKFRRREYRLERILLAARMDEGDSSCLHQCRAETFALLKHCLIGTAYQLPVVVALPVYRLSLPPHYLVCLPGGDTHLAGIATPHAAYLPLLVRLFPLQ